MQKGINKASSQNDKSTPPVEIEEFATLRDFKKRFPSKIYVCSRCGSLVTDPYFCINCNMQNTNFLYKQNTYSYRIIEGNITNTIFKPIEV